MPCKTGGRRPPLPAFVPHLRDCGVASGCRTEIHSRILNENQVGMSNVATMTKLIAVVTSGLFFAGKKLAGEQGKIRKKEGKKRQKEAKGLFGGPHLPAGQKRKMEA